MGAEDDRSFRLRMCADVTALMVLQRTRALKALLRRSLASGRLRRRFLEELMIHLSLVLGFPHMLQGLELLAALAPSSRAGILESKSSAKLRTRGLRTFRRVYGRRSDRVLFFLDSLRPGLSRWILENVYGRVYGRPGMSLAEREVATIVALQLHGHTKQLNGHLAGALRSGLKSQELCVLLVRLEKLYNVRTRAAQAAVQEIARRRSGHGLGAGIRALKAAKN